VALPTGGDLSWSFLFLWLRLHCVLFIFAFTFHFFDFGLELLGLDVVVKASFREDASEDLFLLLSELLQGCGDICEFLFGFSVLGVEFE